MLSRRMRDAVRDGSPLSRRDGEPPGSFHPLHVGLVRAGEAGGKLAQTLVAHGRTAGPAAQPGGDDQFGAVISIPVAGGGNRVGGAAADEVLPQFVPMFEQSGAKLPPSTQLLIEAGACRFGLLAVHCCWSLLAGTFLAVRMRAAPPGTAIARRPDEAARCRSWARCCGRCWRPGSPASWARCWSTACR